MGKVWTQVSFHLSHDVMMVVWLLMMMVNFHIDVFFRMHYDSRLEFNRMGSIMMDRTMRMVLHDFVIGFL